MNHLPFNDHLHTLAQREALKDLLLSKVTSARLKRQVQLFGKKLPGFTKSHVGYDVLEMRNDKLLGSLTKQHKL